MRILEIVSGTQPNGAVTQTIELIRRLRVRGHDLTLLCRPQAWIADQLSDQLPKQIITSDFRRFPFSELKRITTIAHDRKIELLHTHMSRAHSFGAALRWYSGIPSVATAHCRLWQPHWWYNDYVIANSEATLSFQRRWNRVSASRSSVIPYFVDIQRFRDVPATARTEIRSELEIEDDQLAVCILGDICARKGQLHLIRAWKTVLHKVPRARLLIVGNGVPDYESRVRGEASRLGLDHTVSWIAYRHDVPELLGAVDLLVSAAVEEPLGLTIPEAMASGLAVVGTRVGGIPENVVDGVTGLLVPPADPGKLAAAICDLLQNPERRKRMGLAGAVRVAERYEANGSLDAIERVFRAVRRDNAINS